MDLIFALTLAIAVIFVINSQWGIMLQNADGYQTRISAEKAAHTAAFYLISGPGYPSNWTASSYQLVGVAKDLDVIDQTKFSTLMRLDNATLGNALGVPEYKILVNLTRGDDRTINSTGLAPLNPSISARILSFVSYNSVPSKLYVTVWK